MVVLFYRQVLEEMEMLSAFTAVLHVPNLSKAEHLLNVLEASDVFTNQELKQFTHQIHGKRYGKIFSVTCFSFPVIFQDFHRSKETVGPDRYG